MPKPRHKLPPIQQLTFDLRPFLPLAIAFGSGILMALAIAPLNLYPLAWIALAPLWVLIFGNSRTSESSHPPPSPFLLALLWGIGYHGLALSWILGLHPLTWMGIPWVGSIAIALFCWAFITFWGAATVLIWVWLMRVLERDFRSQESRLSIHSKFKIQNSKFPDSPLPTPWIRVLVGTALWCSLEWFRSLGALDWTPLSFTQSPGNLLILHLGQISGPLLVTAAIVAVNGLLAEAWIRGRGSWVMGGHGSEAIENSKLKIQNSPPLSSLIPHPSIFSSPSPKLLTGAVLLLLVLHLVGFGLYSRPLVPANGAALKVGIVQGNVPTRIKLFSEGVRRAEEGYSQGYEMLVAQGVEAVLTPEGALPFLWNQQNSKGSKFYQTVLKNQVTAWLGTFTAQNGGIARSLLTLTGNGQVFSIYNKIKLVPLGEYTPFQKLLGSIIGRLSPVDQDGAPGNSTQRFDTPSGQAIASICYDSAFAEVFRGQAVAGGQFILTASNLDPYSEVLMAQHQAQDLMRAIETDRWAVRATNTGYSGIIDPHGTIIWRSQPKIFESHADTIYRRQTQTLYVRWGDWFTPLLGGAAGVIWLFQKMQIRKLNQ